MLAVKTLLVLSSETDRATTKVKPVLVIVKQLTTLPAAVIVKYPVYQSGEPCSL